MPCLVYALVGGIRKDEIERVAGVYCIYLLSLLKNFEQINDILEPFILNDR